jgi:acyl-CoA synthetase (NDP forming)
MTDQPRDLSRLLRPRSIAVIGGGFFAPNVVRQCLKMEFGGAIWPVHPSRDAVAGVRAFRSLADLPSAPDATFIGVNRNLTVEVVRELRAMGAGGAICFAAGFKETSAYDADGEGLQAALVEAAGDMPVIGPNCYGLINYADGALLWPDQHGGRRLAEGERGAAIITQSSNIACNLTMQTRGLPLAFLMTAGNQAQTGLSEMALGLIEDERVTSLGLHIEGFDSVAGFERLAARARELNKPIVAMKVGRSEQARAATVSHTASLAGSDAASDAFLRRLGIPRVDTIPSFLETLKLFHAVGPLPGGRLSSMSCSGGEASVMADTAVGRRVHFPALEAEHKARVEMTLGPLVAVANPLDYNTYIWAKEEALTAAFSAMVSGGFDLNLLVLDFPRTDRCSDADWWPTVNAFETALKASGGRGAIVASMGENLPEGHAEALLRAGIVPISGIAEAFDAAEAAVMVGEAWGRPSSPPIGGRGAGRSEAVRGPGAELRGFPPHRPGFAGPPLPPDGGRGKAPTRRGRCQGLARRGRSLRSRRPPRRDARRGRRGGRGARVPRGREGAGGRPQVGGRSGEAQPSRCGCGARGSGGDRGPRHRPLCRAHGDGWRRRADRRCDARSAVRAGDDGGFGWRHGGTAQGFRHAAPARLARGHRGGAALAQAVPAARRVSRTGEGRSRGGHRRDRKDRRFRAGDRRDRDGHQPADRVCGRARRLGGGCADGGGGDEMILTGVPSRRRARTFAAKPFRRIS